MPIGDSRNTYNGKRAKPIDSSRQTPVTQLGFQARESAKSS